LSARNFDIYPINVRIVTTKSTY